MRRLCLLVLIASACLGLAPTPTRAADWGWPLPAPDRVMRPFDPPAEPWLTGHRGVDLAGWGGEVVRASGAGVVSFAGRVAGLPVVSIRHPDGLLTTYQPVLASVRAGQRVRLGQRLGRLTRAGSHCAPQACLHWGLRRGADYLDPLGLLGLGQVRLLPLAGPGGWVPSAASGISLGTMSAAAGVVFLSRRRRSARPRPRPIRSAGRRSPAPRSR